MQRQKYFFMGILRMVSYLIPSTSCQLYTDDHEFAVSPSEHSRAVKVRLSF